MADENPSASPIITSFYLKTEAGKGVGYHFFEAVFKGKMFFSGFRLSLFPSAVAMFSFLLPESNPREPPKLLSFALPES